MPDIGRGDEAHAYDQMTSIIAPTRFIRDHGGQRDRGGDPVFSVRFARVMRWVLAAALLLLAGVGFSQQQRKSLDRDYRDTAAKLIGAALVDTDGYGKLAYLCDRIGNRLSGSASLGRAVEW